MLVRSIGCVFAICIVAGCGRQQQGPERLHTVPVHGSVMLNGVPAPRLTVKFHSLEKPEGASQIYAAHPSAMTEGDGTFAVSTYEFGDGIAAGTYAVTFEWLTYNRLQNSYGAPDKLDGKYSDPEKTEYKVTVSGDEEAINLEPFELTK